MESIALIVGSAEFVSKADDLEIMIAIEASNRKMLPWKKETLRAQIMDGCGVLALKNGEVVGYCGLVTWEKYWEVGALIVRSDCRNIGLGMKLIAEVISLAITKDREREIIIFPNKTSAKIAGKLGFCLQEKSYFSQEVFDSCVTCQEKDCFPNCHCSPMTLPNTATGENDFFVMQVERKHEGIISNIASLYCEVWKEAPWNEDFWEKDEVLKDILSQIENPKAIVLCAMKRENVVGFTWGYPVTQEVLRKIASNNLLDFLFEGEEPLFYVDELAVSGSCRQHKAGRRLSQKLIELARLQGATRFCLRTDIKAVAARALYEKLGFKDLGIADSGHPDRTYWLLE